MKTATLVALALALAAGGARAQTEMRQDGNELLEKCVQAEALTEGRSLETDEQRYGALWCLAVIHGVEDTFRTMEMKEGRCLSGIAGVTSGQLVRVVVKFLRDYPTMLNHMDTWLVMKAIEVAFPPVPCEFEGP